MTQKCKMCVTVEVVAKNVQPTNRRLLLLVRRNCDKHLLVT
jgi:hypothetical protein